LFSLFWDFPNFSVFPTAPTSSPSGVSLQYDHFNLKGFRPIFGQAVEGSLGGGVGGVVVGGVDAKGQGWLRHVSIFFCLNPRTPLSGGGAG